MTTYRDITSFDEAWQVILASTESVTRRMREQGFHARTVQLSLRNCNLSWQERQTKLSLPSCTVLDLASRAMELLRTSWNEGIPLRFLGVRACDLVDASSGLQLAFFDNVKDLVFKQFAELL
jgi:DNA polymerase-4